MSVHVSLEKALEGYFDKDFEKLPNALINRVLTELQMEQMDWNMLSPDARRNKVPEIEAAIRRADDQERKDWATLFECNTANEKELKRLKSLKALTVNEDLEQKRLVEKLQQEIDFFEQKLARGDCLDRLNPDSDQYEPGSSIRATPCQPAYAHQICLNFSVIEDADQNEKWWKVRLGEAEDYGLLDCRFGEGKKGRGLGTLWWPDLIAHWLVERESKGRKGLRPSAASKALKKFPGCAEVADDLFPADE